MASNNVVANDVTLLAASLTKKQVKAENKVLKLVETTLKNKINSLESNNKYLKAREMDAWDIRLLKRASIKESNKATKQKNESCKCKLSGLKSVNESSKQTINSLCIKSLSLFVALKNTKKNKNCY